MNPTFVENGNFFRHNQAIDVAITNLSVRGYLIECIKDTGQLASIKIKQPLTIEGVEITVTPDNKHGWCEYHNCRVWWSLE